MDLQAPFNCSNNELGCCIGPFSSFSMDWHVVKSFWSSFSFITLTILMLFKLWHHGFFGKFPEILLEIEIKIVLDIWLLLSFFPSIQENENQSNVIWLKLSNKKNMLTRIPSLNSFFGKSRRPTTFEIISIKPLREIWFQKSSRNAWKVLNRSRKWFLPQKLYRTIYWKCSTNYFRNILPNSSMYQVKSRLSF